MPERLDNDESKVNPTLVEHLVKVGEPVTNADKQGWIEMDLNEPFGIQVGDHIRILNRSGEIVEGYFDGTVRYFPVPKIWRIQLRTGETEATEIGMGEAVAVKIK